MARKALGRGLDALIPNARDLLTPSSKSLPGRDDEDHEADDEGQVKNRAERPELAVDRDGLVRLSQAPATGAPAERVPHGTAGVEPPPVPQREAPIAPVGSIPSAAGPAGPGSLSPL